MNRKLTALTLSSVMALALGCGAAQTPAKGLQPVKGGGKYATVLPENENPPWNMHKKAPAQPKVSASFSQLPTTNEWWSSLIWQTGKDPHSESMYPHPLTLRAEAGGLQVGYPTVPTIEPRNYFYLHKPEIVAGVAGLDAPKTVVERYGDWTVTASWKKGDRSLELTFGHGLPFVYATKVKGPARVAVPKQAGRATISKVADNVVTIDVGDHRYAAFAPSGAAWNVKGRGVESTLAGKDFFSVAALPDQKPATLEAFKTHAYAFVTDSRVSWKYEPATATVRAKYELVVEPREMGEEYSQQPLQALYRHQWMRTSAKLTDRTYVSPRGQMKLLAGKSFETTAKLGTLLPALPDAGSYDRGHLEGLITMASNLEAFGIGLEGTRDSYWEGKNFGRTANLVYLAHQVGDTSARDDLLEALKNELEDWFDGAAPRYYYYDKTWHTLIGIPTMYHSGTQLNDHHFHYAYYVFAAATVALFDRAWAKRWAPSVERLIRDAGSWDRKDTEFPFLRYFDVYAGHSWATGTTFFPWGNNEESSSEDVNFAAAMAMWGEVMGRPAIRDAGLYMYSCLVDTVEQYWYDVDREVFPKGFAHPYLGMVWGAGGKYDTWFSYLPPYIQGIQLTPFSVGSLWLGRRPDSIERRFDHTVKQNGGTITLWRDLFWMMLSLSDPKRPIKWFEAEHHYDPEYGNSMAFLYHFIHNMNALGHVDTSVTADTPFYTVFKKGSAKSYVAFNGTTKPRTVKFSDGRTLSVKPGEIAVQKAGQNKP